MESQRGGILRGIFGADDEVVDTFKNGVPVFSTKGECIRWMESHSCQGSNPDWPHLQHIFTHLVDWGQIERFLLPRLEGTFRLTGKAAAASARRAAAVDLSSNRFVNEQECAHVRDSLMQRLSLPFHRETNSESTYNTLRYLFFHMRCGIFVCIRDQRLVAFVPFVNREYRNSWGGKPDMESSFENYYDDKRSYCRRENILPNKSEWWANGNIICNEHHRPSEDKTQWWGDHLLAPLKSMLEHLCKERDVPDAEFFLNKRDFPQLRSDRTEAYDFIFDRGDAVLPPEYRECSFAPILSFYCSPDFADLPMPTTEDWEGAVGLVFPPSFCRDTLGGKKMGSSGSAGALGPPGTLKQPRDLYTEANFRKFHVPWERKVNTAFFRGGATGGGTKPSNNQRLKVAQLSHQWASEPSQAAAIKARRGGDVGAEHPLLDAGVVGFNIRDKKIRGEPMTFLRPDTLGFDKVGYVPMYEQGTFKYILYIEGHCAANRYAFLMRLGSVIFKVDSKCEASEMWFFPLLRPYSGGRDNPELPVEEDGADHILVDKECADLRFWIEWARAHDDQCRQIAENARRRYERCISREAILDYFQLVVVETARRFRHAPQWWARRGGYGADDTAQPPPIRAPPPTQQCFKDRRCKRCLERVEERRTEAQKLEAAKRRSVATAARTKSEPSGSAGGGSSAPRAKCRKCRRAIEKCTCENTSRKRPKLN